MGTARISIFKVMTYTQFFTKGYTLFPSAYIKELLRFYLTLSLMSFLCSLCPFCSFGIFPPFFLISSNRSIALGNL